MDIQTNIKNKILTDGVNLIHVDSCDSTNRMLRELAENGAPEKTVVIASMQTDGRGRLGRSFFSPDNSGLYMSILLRPEVSPENALEITTTAGIAMIRVLKEYVSGELGIKWVNDIYLNMKKVCGILTESSFNSDGTALKYAILGIGVNLFPPKHGFPDEIKSIADSVFKNAPDKNLFCEIAAKIIDAFFELYPLIGTNTLVHEYKSYSVLTGKEVIITTPSAKTSATVLGINNDYSLSVLTEYGENLNINSGDVSLSIKKK